MRGGLAFTGFLAAVAVAAAAGFFAGRETSLRDVERRIASFELQHTLGAVLAAGDPYDTATGEDPRRRYALAYHDPERAVREMDDYAWAVPSTPTPFVGYAPAPGAHANAVVNAQQFRHAGELAVPKPPGRRRLFLLGGSTAFGSGAPSQERTISGYLQALLDVAAGQDARAGRWEVVNAAAPGWASTHERIWAIDRVAPLEPDLVVALSGLNDVHWGAVGFDVRRFRPYDAQHYFDLLRRVYRGADRMLPDVAPLGDRPVRPEEVAARLAANLHLTAAALRDRGIPYVFLLQPHLATTGKTLSEREARMRARNARGPRPNRYFRACYGAIQAALSGPEPPSPWLDLGDVFDDADADTEIFLDAYHFGDRGNEWLARALAARLAPWLAAPGRHGPG